MVEVLKEKLGVKEGQPFSYQGKIYKFGTDSFLEYINGSWTCRYFIPFYLIHSPSPKIIQVPPDWQCYYANYYRPKTWKERLIEWLKI